MIDEKPKSRKKDKINKLFQLHAVANGPFYSYSTFDRHWFIALIKTGSS